MEGGVGAARGMRLIGKSARDASIFWLRRAAEREGNQLFHLERAAATESLFGDAKKPRMGVRRVDTFLARASPGSDPRGTDRPRWRRRRFAPRARLSRRRRERTRLAGPRGSSGGAPRRPARARLLLSPNRRPRASTREASARASRVSAGSLAVPWWTRATPSRPSTTATRDATRRSARRRTKPPFRVRETTSFRRRLARVTRERTTPLSPVPSQFWRRRPRTETRLSRERIRVGNETQRHFPEKKTRGGSRCSTHR